MILNNHITLLTMAFAHLNRSFAKVQLHLIPKPRRNFWRELHLSATQKQKKETARINTCNVSNETKRSNNIMLQKMCDYINSIDPNVLKHVPKQCLSFHTSCRGPHLIEEDTAKKFVSLIIDDLLKNTCFVAEAFSGLGIMTKALLNAGVPFIHMYEDVQEFRPILTNLANEFPNRVELRNYNFLNLGKLMYFDNVYNGSQLKNALKDISHKNWEDSTCMQIVTVINSETFMRQILMNLIFSNCLMVYGRPVIYGAIRPSLWMRYTTQPHKLIGTGNILFNICFDYEKLGEINRKSYIPWPKSQGSHKIIKGRRAKDSDIFYVVKMEPKIDLFTKIIRKKDLVPFWHFLRHNFVPKKKRVIPELEKLMPDCGFKLISKDYTIFTDFHHLSPQQILELYREITSWPEFKTSAFMPSVEAVLSKMDENLIANATVNPELKEHLS